ncbi:MAG: IPT/TIG domain-containing protein, partial [Syntrophomonadaceae bacterium]|nr:IPT/TIG domain-containing protein [Syntrophomonadaceae bacterium]
SGFNPSRINLLQSDGSIVAEERPLLRFGNLSATADIVGGRVPNLQVTGNLKANYDANQQSITLTLIPNPGVSYQRTFTGFDGQERFINLGLLQDAEGNSYPGYELVKIQVVQDPGNRLRVDRGYATDSTLISSEQMEVVTPTYYTVGEVALTLINPDKAMAASRFIYKNPDSQPQITNIARDGRYPQDMTIDGRQVKVVRMNYKGKSEVSVFGEDFRENARLQIGSIINLDSSSISYTLPNKLTFIMPDVAEIEVGKLHRVVVMNEDGGTASSDEPVSGLDADKIYLQFTKGETLPQITAVTPSMGPVSGGTRVKIEGLDFRATIEGYEGEQLSVKFGGQEAASVQVVDYKTIYAMTPVNSPGNLTVRVENPDGETTDPVGSFTYISSPQVTAVVDAADPTENTRITVISVEGNQEIKLKGSGFMEGARVVFMPVTAPAAENSSGNIIYRVKSKTEDNYTSQVLDPYILQSGVEAAAKFIDSETLTLTTPSGKLDMKGLIVVNPDKGASPPFEDISFGLPEISAPEGKVWAEILYDSYYHTDRAIKVNWNPVTGATQYEIYVVREDQVDFVGSTQLTAYLLQDIKPYTRYKFIIKAVGDFGSSKPSAESNQVRTGGKVGIPDFDGKPGEKTVMQKLGNSAQITIGSQDYTSRPIVIDLTRDALAGATEAVIQLPASVISTSKPPEIEVKGRDFNLRFNPTVFNTSRVSENRNREDAGVRFSISPYKGNPGTASGNILSPVYQLNALFYKGKEQSDFSYLGGRLSLMLDYDKQKAEWRRLNQVNLQRYDQTTGRWVDLDTGTAGWSAGGGAINRTGLYSVMGSRR